MYFEKNQWKENKRKIQVSKIKKNHQEKILSGRKDFFYGKQVYNNLCSLIC